MTFPLAYYPDRSFTWENVSESNLASCPHARLRLEGKREKEKGKTGISRRSEGLMPLDLSSNLLATSDRSYRTLERTTDNWRVSAVAQSAIPRNESRGMSLSNDREPNL